MVVFGEDGGQLLELAAKPRRVFIEGFEEAVNPYRLSQQALILQSVGAHVSRFVAGRVVAQGWGIGRFEREARLPVCQSARFGFFLCQLGAPQGKQPLWSFRCVEASVSPKK